MLALGSRLLFLLVGLGPSLTLGGLCWSSSAFASEHESGGSALEYGSELRILTWKRILESVRTASDQTKLEKINRYFNQLEFVPDAKRWGRSDYWATPVEFLKSGAGDCEDFAVAKYISLLQLGVPVDRLRLVYALAVRRNEAHMVLAYFKTPQADPLILDNLVADMRPASRRKDLLLVYSFNNDGLWLTRRNGKSDRVGNSNRLGAWRDFQERMLGTLAQTD